MSHAIRGRVGAPIPELVVTPDRAQLFLFSAATWNRNPIHYSRDAAVAEGLPDVVVQRGLIGNFLARLLGRWLGDDGHICELSWRVTQSAVPGRTLCCRGRVVGDERAGSARLLRCELSVIDAGGRTIATGRAQVRVRGGE